MVTDVGADLVVAARDGDRAALEKVLAGYLPLVYNLVGRALAREVDVAETVREVMVQAARRLPGLRNAAAFRSWLVALAMHQVRQCHQRREPGAVDAFAGPGTDFADVTISALGLGGQWLEAVRAVPWLDDEHREALSLWWQEEAGRLGRAELVAALGLDPRATAVRIDGMKEQLEEARGIVRALSVVPRCPELASGTATWAGEPSPAWRKRIERHLRWCGSCRAASADLVPVEGLVARLALVPLPVGLAARVASVLPPPTGGEHSTRRSSRGRSARGGPGLSLLKATGAVVATAPPAGTVAMAAGDAGQSARPDHTAGAGPARPAE
jgi:DNA-directed RNA polymerase specialized sigma24 family protein